MKAVQRPAFTQPDPAPDFFAHAPRSTCFDGAVALYRQGRPDRELERSAVRFVGTGERFPRPRGLARAASCLCKSTGVEARPAAG